jgi:uncharacterized protein
MLELRPICENCGKNLPNESNEAMICSFECTFCKDCVDNILDNVCPNCGGGMEKRPIRPKEKLLKFPQQAKPYLKVCNLAGFQPILDKNKDLQPNQR